MAGTLTGIRVVDWTIWHQGPVATTMLGDLGAEVIKIEDRVAGDPARGLARVAGVMTGIARDFFFESVNRNKKGIALDLTKQAGKDIVYRLVERSDVFVQNFRLGVAERLGLDYQTLNRYNPKLIYVNASGLGPKGPECDRPLVDYAGLARSGLMTAVGEPDMPPINMSGIADRVGGIMTAYSVLAALVARERLGIGQEVHTSLLGGMLALQGYYVDATLALGQPLPRAKRETNANPLYNHYHCADGKWLVLAMLQPDRYWSDLCRVMGLSALESDPRFDCLEARARNAEELIAIFDKVFATKSRGEWLSILREGGDLTCGPVQTMTEVVGDPQVLANGYVIERDHPNYGRIRTSGLPFELTKTPLSVDSDAPEFGQHTEEVLLDILGYGWEEIAALRDQEVI